MPSDARSELLDLERGLPTTAEDVAALRRLRQHPPVSTRDLLRFLASLKPPTWQELRSRHGPRGEPFRL